MSQFVPTESSPRWWSSLYELLTFGGWATTNRALLIAALGVVTAFTATLRKTLGPPWYWSAIQEILGDFQRQTFDALGSETVTDHHRITLYRFQHCCLWPGNRWHFWWPWGQGCWPWSGWLVPVVRAGPKSRSKSVFRADAEQTSEGIAGRTYFTQSNVLEVSNLDEVTAESDATLIDDYAKKSFVKADWIRSRILQKRPCARYFRSMRIELSGSVWVLMIDSTEPRLPKPQSAIAKFEQLESVLRVLLRKA